MDIRDRPYFIARLVSWHEEDHHDRILSAIDKLGKEHWDYEIAGYYARALNNLERYKDALDILLDYKEEGKSDGLWYFRVGYSLYYLSRESEAAEFFLKAIEFGDDDDSTRLLLQASIEEADLRQKHGGREYRPELYSGDELLALEAHIEKYFGSYQNVYHEIESPDIHVDIAVIEPCPQRNYYVLVTMGMGAHRMNVPPGSQGQDRAELMVCLPPEWNLDSLDDEKWYWPLRWLKILARLPINDNTWLGWGHTIPNGEPFANNTRLCTILLLNPGAFGKESAFCTLPNGDRINFYQMIPLYDEETQFKIKNNAQIFLRFLDHEALEYVQIDRENICDDIITF
ncbi:MAG: suppressor of fused domain protein [Treponema sp.]|nr:suppressor of fused domain protein [Treponema sp.]